MVRPATPRRLAPYSPRDSSSPGSTIYHFGQNNPAYGFRIPAIRQGEKSQVQLNKAECEMLFQDMPKRWNWTPFNYNLNF